MRTCGVFFCCKILFFLLFLSKDLLYSTFLNSKYYAIFLKKLSKKSLLFLYIIHKLFSYIKCYPNLFWIYLYIIYFFNCIYK